MPENDERLESIRSGHGAEKNNASSARMEDYLEVIAELVKQKGYATTLDISRYMSVSAPSVTKMLQRLDEGGYLKYERYHGINLTAKGSSIAESIRQRHGILLEFFGMLGITGKAADTDVEGVEHYLNTNTLERLEKFVEFLRVNPDIMKKFESS